MSHARRLRRVVTAGVFDGLHDGHRWYLRTAKKLGDHLTVIVARDATVPIVKNKHPKHSERSRVAAVAALPGVDRAMLGGLIRSTHPDERFRILVFLRPAVICLGYDQPVNARALRKFLDRHGFKKTRIVRARKKPEK